ncbi:MAG: hypothetical protein FWG65_12530 [Turicibacter sp.]|nr:hypothetical protein [Turicibacter sp.]
MKKMFRFKKNLAVMIAFVMVAVLAFGSLTTFALNYDTATTETTFNFEPIIFIDYEQEGHEEFSQQFEEFVGLLAEMEFDSVVEEVIARHELFEEHFSGQLEINADEGSVWVKFFLNLPGHFADYEPQLTAFHQRNVDGQLFQGYLSRGSFGKNPSQNNVGLWDFVVVYTGELFLENFPTPEGVHPEHGVEPGFEERAIREQNLLDTMESLSPVIAESRGQTVEEMRAEQIAILSASDGLFVEVQEFFWNRQTTFQPQNFLIYSREVDGVVYRGELAIVRSATVSLDNGLGDFLAVYMGTLVADVPPAEPIVAEYGEIAQMLEQAMAALSQMQVETIEEEFAAIDYIFANYLNFVLNAEVEADSKWDSVTVAFLGESEQFQPNSSRFYHTMVDGQLFNGELHLTEVASVPSRTRPGTWDFFAVYSGIVSAWGLPTPFSPEYELEPDDVAVRKQILHDTLADLADYRGVTVETLMYVERMPIILPSGLIVVVDQNFLPESAEFVQVERFLWGVPVDFRVDTRIPYSRNVNGVLQEGWLSLNRFIMANPQNGDRFDVLAFYAGTLFANN